METLEEKVQHALESTGAPFEIIDIDPAFSDTATFCEKYNFPLDNVVNTIIVATKKEPKQYAACVIQGTRRLDVNHALRQLMNGAKLSFASAEETKTLTGMMIGGVTVFGLPDDLPIFVDEHLMPLEWVILGAGSRDKKIKISPNVFTLLQKTTIARISSG